MKWKTPLKAIKFIVTAGYALYDCETFDLVITFCIERIYDINKVNRTLDYFSIKPLAGASE